MLQCELLAILIVKFDNFARGFAGEKANLGELQQLWDYLPWHKKPEEDKKSKHSLQPWLDS